MVKAVEEPDSRVGERGNEIMRLIAATSHTDGDVEISALIYVVALGVIVGSDMSPDQEMLNHFVGAISDAIEAAHDEIPF